MIIDTREIEHIYLATSHIDMRKSIDGLALTVSMEFRLDVMGGSVFIFTNRARNRIKMLYYDVNGFWLFFKWLEQGNFKVYEDEKIDTINGKINITKKVGLTITTYGNDRLLTGYLFFDKISYILCIGDLYGKKYYRRVNDFETT